MFDETIVAAQPQPPTDDNNNNNDVAAKFTVGFVKMYDAGVKKKSCGSQNRLFTIACPHG